MSIAFHLKIILWLYFADYVVIVNQNHSPIILLVLFFSIKHFAELYSAKLGFKAEVLLKTLWGDFFLENKTKRIRKGAQVSQSVLGALSL